MNLIEQQSQRMMEWAANAETRTRTFPGGGLVIDVARAYSEDRCSMLAAALSYYALLSLFPLLLFILAVMSQFLQTEEAIRVVTRFVSSYLPSGTLLVRNALEQVTRVRGPLTIVGGVGFVWSASGVFDSIQLGFNRAFRVPSPRPIWRRRLFSIGMVFAGGMLFGLSFGLTAVMRMAIHYRLLERGELLFDVLPTAAAIVLSTAVFGLLYRYVPYDPGIRWRDIALSAFIAATLWEIAKLGFAWYITDIALLNTVYGSLGTVIAIMIWGYLTAAILLMGAELAAVRAGARQRVKTGKEWWALVSP